MIIKLPFISLRVALWPKFWPTKTQYVNQTCAYSVSLKALIYMAELRMDWRLPNSFDSCLYCEDIIDKLRHTVEEFWYFYEKPPPMFRSPQIKMALWPSRLWNQTFISAEWLRSIRLSTDKCQVFSVDCIVCDSCPLALSLIGRTRNWPYSIYLNRGCTCVVQLLLVLLFRHSAKS